MAKRRITKADSERIRAEVEESIRNPKPTYAASVLCACGHWEQQQLRSCLAPPPTPPHCEPCRWNKLIKR